MKYVSENTRQWVKAALFCAMLGGVQTALAAGGLSTAESSLKEWFKEWYNILAVVSGVIIVGVAILGAMREMQFGDILKVCGWIFLVGCGPALAMAIFKLGQSTTF